MCRRRQSRGRYRNASASVHRSPEKAASWDADFTLLRWSRAQLSWLIYLRPDICVTSSKLSRVTEKTLERNHVNMVNTAVNYLDESRVPSLETSKPDMDSLNIPAYADASFAPIRNLTSQLGYIILLCDKWANSTTLHYASYKELLNCSIRSKCRNVRVRWCIWLVCSAKKDMGTIKGQVDTIGDIYRLEKFMLCHQLVFADARASFHHWSASSSRCLQGTWNIQCWHHTWP